MHCTNNRTQTKQHAPVKLTSLSINDGPLEGLSSCCTSVHPSASESPPMPAYRKSLLSGVGSALPLAVSRPPAIHPTCSYPARTSCSAAASDLCTERVRRIHDALVVHANCMEAEIVWH